MLRLSQSKTYQLLLNGLKGSEGDVTSQGRFATTIFSATQLYNVIVALFRMAAVLFRHLNPVLR